MSKEAKIPLLNKEKRAQNHYLRRWLTAIAIGASAIAVAEGMNGNVVNHPEAKVTSDSTVTIKPGSAVHKTASPDYGSDGLSQNIEAETKAEITIKDPVFVVEHTGTVNNSIGGGTENEDWVYVPGNKYSPEGWINATELMQQGYISYSDANNNMLPVTGSASTATWDSKQNEYLNTQGKAVDIIVNKKAA